MEGKGRTWAERGEGWSLPSTTEIAVDVAVAVAGICEVVVVVMITVVVAVRVAVDFGRVVVTVTVYGRGFRVSVTLSGIYHPACWMISGSRGLLPPPRTWFEKQETGTESAPRNNVPGSG